MITLKKILQREKLLDTAKRNEGEKLDVVYNKCSERKGSFPKVF